MLKIRRYLIEFDRLVEITPKGGYINSQVKYSFMVSGVPGAATMRLNPKPVIQGTEGGLQNMVTLSEETQT